MKHYTADVLFEAEATLGEGPCWDTATQRLWYVDIDGYRVCRYDPETRDLESWPIGTHVSFVCPTQQGDLVIGTRKGIARLNPANGEVTPIVDPEANIETTRFNDGKADPQGRLWAGTMSDKRSPEGALYLLDGDGRIEPKVTGVTVSNGLAWNADCSIMYYIDSPTFRVDAFDFDSASGAISSRRPAVMVPESMGKPDGMTIDAEGMLWVALFRGSAVTRWNPLTGELLAKVDVPASHVTCPVFGGRNFDKLYITTARTGLDEAALAKEPLAGAIFVAEVGVCGRAPDTFAG